MTDFTANPFRSPVFLDRHAAGAGDLRDEIVHGLLATPATIAPKHFYDPLGSALFAAICLTDEYYPTRTEAVLLAAHGAAIARAIGPDACLIDLGAGDCAKAAGLFDRLRPARYLALDISVEYLRDSLGALARRYPAIAMAGIGTDFSSQLDLGGQASAERRWFFYPGSSIGNFDPAQSRAFLARLREQTDPQGGLLIGIDLVKPQPVLDAAYNDALGVTAAFNRNVLRHLNRLVGSDFEIGQWDHRAFYDPRHGRIEMHLEAREPVTVRWPGGARSWQAGERIHTENSWKFTLAGFEAILRDAGFRLDQAWRDERDWFALVLARPV
jgi:dimethylhistidine N-methyltransferase